MSLTIGNKMGWGGGKQRRLYSFMYTCASFPVELREEATIGGGGKILLSSCLPALTHQKHCLGILISWREQQNKFCQKSRSRLNISDFYFPLLILQSQQ